MNMLSHIKILGYSILDEPAARVAAVVCDELGALRPKSFVFLNPHSVVIAEREPAFRNAIVNADGIFCDGVGLSLAGLLLNRRRAARVYGFEFFVALSRELSARKLGRVFFLGGTADSISRLRMQIPIGIFGYSRRGVLRTSLQTRVLQRGYQGDGASNRGVSRRYIMDWSRLAETREGSI